MAKIVFLQDQWVEYLGVMYISAVLRKHGHQCELFIDQNTKRIVRNIQRIQPDIVAFSTTTGLHRWVLATAKQIKREKKKTITLLGGPHPTYFPQVIEDDSVDVICRGEGEYPMLDLANAIDKKNEIINIPNFWVKKNGTIYKNDLRPLIENLDELPFPDRNIYLKYYLFRTEPTKMFITSRGCPYNCSYCYNQKLRELYRNKGKYVRQRSIKNIIDEIKYVINIHKLKTVYFMDDTFTFDREWLFEFLKVYKNEVNLPFICLGTANHLVDEKLVQEFKNSGCYGVYFGIESGNEKIRNELLNKKISNDEILMAAKNLKKYGLKFRTYNMVGLPGETIENVYETINLNIQIKTDYPWCSIFTPYIGTTSCEHAIKKGLLGRNFGQDSFQRSFFAYSLIKQNNMNEIVNIQKFFQTVVFFPWLLPLVKKIVKLPPNLFFRLWFGVLYYWILVHSEHKSFFWTIWFGLRNVHFLLEKKISKSYG